MRFLELRLRFRRCDRDTWRGVAALLWLVLPAVARPDSDTPLLKDALEAIARTGVRLIYSSDIVSPDLRVRRPTSGTTVAEQLQSLLGPLDLAAQPLPGGYAIVAAPRASASLKLSVSARAAPGDPVVGALISIPRVNRWARTDRLGAADFTDLPAATYDVRIRADGFRTETRAIHVDPASGAVALDIRLDRDVTTLDHVVVETSRYDVSMTAGIPAARETLENSSIASNDVARSLQLFPGAAVAGYTARTHVRGSRDDETLFRYDGLTLNDPYHLKTVQSLFSAIDPAIVESVTSWTGNPPIQFGGRIGAVVDIEPRTITSPTIDVKASQQSGRLFIGTPFGGDRGSVFAAVRLGNSLSPAGWADRETGPPSNNDLVVRSTWAFGPHTRLAAGILGIDDRREAYDLGAVRVRAVSGQELYTWLRLIHDAAANLRSETLVSTEDSHNRVSGRANPNEVAFGFLNEHNRHSAFTVREDVTLSPTPRWSARVGVERIDARVEDQERSFVRFEAPFVPGLQPAASARLNLDLSTHAQSTAVYGGLRWRASASTVADIGLRRESRDYAPLASDRLWNVRVNLRQQISDATTMKIGWGQVSQADVFEANSGVDGGFEPTDIRRLTHSNLSLEYTLPNGWFLRTEAYDKREGAPLTTSENAFSQFTLLPELGVDRQLVQAQRGRMHGLEIRLETDPSRSLAGSVSYAWSRAEDRIAGRWTPRSWDQPHALQIDGSWHRGGWYVVGDLSWHSGWPYTPLLASSTNWSDPAAVSITLAPRNSARLDNFLSLNLRVTWEHSLQGGIFQAFLDLYDLTNSKSVCCRSYTVISLPDGSSQLVERRAPWLTFTPIVGVRWRR